MTKFEYWNIGEYWGHIPIRGILGTHPNTVRGVANADVTPPQAVAHRQPQPVVRCAVHCARPPAGWSGTVRSALHQAESEWHGRKPSARAEQSRAG